MGKYLWLAVEPDEYELPLAVCETSKELGLLFGLSATTVIHMARLGADGSRSGRKFVKVRIEE